MSWRWKWVRSTISKKVIRDGRVAGGILVGPGRGEDPFGNRDLAMDPQADISALGPLLMGCSLDGPSAALRWIEF